MLCTHKSAGSNWLDRLRSSKGFSSFDDHNNLEQFLTHPSELRDDGGSSSSSSNNNTGSEKSSSDPVRPVSEPVLHRDRSGGNEEMCSVVKNVLSELFCMGDSPSFSKLNGKKGSRKQMNPRFCATSEINNNAAVVLEGGAGRRKEIAESVLIKDSSQVKLLEQRDDLNLAEEEDKSHANLMGFSRTEVTVIDTSFAPWKSEKLLFRKKNLWKVRDKKSKTMNFGKKKRKAHVTHEDAGGKKKQKVIISGDDGHAANGGVCKYSVNEKLQLNDKLEETCKRTSDSVGQASKKKHGYLKLKKASSSVVLIKSIPPSKKNGTDIAKNFLKPSHRQCQAQ